MPLTQGEAEDVRTLLSQVEQAVNQVVTARDVIRHVLAVDQAPENVDGTLVEAAPVIGYAKEAICSGAQALIAVAVVE